MVAIITRIQSPLARTFIDIFYYFSYGGGAKEKYQK
jgi:hypothetical protein